MLLNELKRIDPLSGKDSLVMFGLIDEGESVCN